jgi:hypothetical protein
MSKRSSFNNPRWVNKKDNNKKLHKMGIDYFIDMKMIELFLYTNTYSKNGGGFSITVNSREDDAIRVCDIEEDIKSTLRYRGLDFWENIEYENLNNDKLEHAKQFARKKFPRWFQDNAKHFMGDSQ